MRYSALIVHSVLLFTVPSTTLYPHINQVQESHLNESLLSFDDILGLMDDLENGELEKRCSEADLERINHFLAHLAKQGILPGDAVEEFVLENDIQELLNGSAFEYSYSIGQGSAAPAIFYDGAQVFHCKSWLSKQWHQAKKFAKKHKKAILLGAAVVVAAVVVVGVIAAATTATAAAAAGAAASGSDKKDKDKPTAGESPILKSAIEEHISAFKEVVVEDNLLPTSEQPQGHPDPSFGEHVRQLGAVLAHETLDGVSELASCVPQLLEEIKELGNWIAPVSLTSGTEITPRANYDKLVIAAHEKIDQAFSTDQAGRYSSDVKAAHNKFAVGILPPPGSFSSAINVPKIREIIKAGEQTALLAEELGLTNREIVRLKNAGALESTVVETFECIVSDKAMLASYEKFRKAEIFLKSSRGQYFSEMEARELIQQFGIQTYPRPSGIPENFKIKISNKGAGIKYVHPEKEGTYIRVMPGKPHSPNASQKRPYINRRIDGNSLDKFGNIVENGSPEAHIPMEEFVYIGDK